MCESYPTLLAVPATVDDTVVELAAKYRQHGRVPIVTYINPRSKVGAEASRGPDVMVSLADLCLLLDTFFFVLV